MTERLLGRTGLEPTLSLQQLCLPPCPCPPRRGLAEPSGDSHPPELLSLKEKLKKEKSPCLLPSSPTLQMVIEDHTVRPCLIKKKVKRVKLGFRCHIIWWEKRKKEKTKYTNSER